MKPARLRHKVDTCPVKTKKQYSYQWEPKHQEKTPIEVTADTVRHYGNKQDQLLKSEIDRVKHAIRTSESEYVKQTLAHYGMALNKIYSGIIILNNVTALKGYNVSAMTCKKHRIPRVMYPMKRPNGDVYYASLCSMCKKERFKTKKDGRETNT